MTYGRAIWFETNAAAVDTIALEDFDGQCAETPGLLRDPDATDDLDYPFSPLHWKF